MKDIDVGKMLVKYPWILSASILENFEKILDFFDEEKVLRSDARFLHLSKSDGCL